MDDRKSGFGGAEPWLPFTIAPRDRRIEVRAERWTAQGERLRIEVFPRCKWCAGGTCRNPGPYWRGLPKGWTPTGWREAARAPAHHQTFTGGHQPCP